jgi:hypothetical protein
MQSLFAWLPPVLCCVAIQGFWMSVLFISNSSQPTDRFQNLQRLSGNSGSTLH